MEKFNYKVVFTKEKDYLNIDVFNSAYDEIDINDISVDFTLQAESETNGLSAELFSLDKLVIDYNTEKGNIVDVLDSEKLKDFKVETEIGNDATAKGMRLDGITIDLIKKYVVLKFNDN